MLICMMFQVETMASLGEVDMMSGEVVVWWHSSLVAF